MKASRPSEIIGFRRPVEYSELERLFVEMAQIVFNYFGKGGERTVVTELHHKGDDFWEDSYTRVNDEITVKVLNEVILHDNSMTSELLYRISLSLSIMSTEVLSMSTQLTSPQTYKLYYQYNPTYQAFVRHYLANLQARLDEYGVSPRNVVI